MRSSRKMITFNPVFTLLLPEVKGRDPDALLAAEIEAKRQAVVGI
jgi:PHS family inorganic phosphate transporter-like MFS transporter